MQESGVTQLVVDEVITETLEADNVTLQNLSASKHVQVGLCYFDKTNATSSRCKYIFRWYGFWKFGSKPQGPQYRL